VAKKVPLVIQMEALECGAACLCMIANHYGKWVKLPQVRKDCGVSRDGSVAKNILAAGRDYGFEAAGYRLEPSDLTDIQMPAIIHWNFNHFVVLTKIDFKKKKAYINDPARGRVVMPFEEFDNAFTGILLSFKPTEKFKPEGEPTSIFLFAKKRLKGSAFPFILMVILSIIVTVIAIVNPVFDKIFIDRILSGNEPNWLTPFLGIVMLVIILNILVEIIKTIYWMKIEGKFAIVSSSEFMWHCLRLPLEFFSQRYIGDIVERQEATGKITLVLIKKIAPIAIDTISLIFYFFIMINFSWKLTIIGLSATILNMILVNYTSKKMAEIQKASMPNSGKLMSVTYSAIEMIETIKSTGAENGFFERWAGFYAKQNNSQISTMNLVQYIGAIPSIIHEIAKIILILSGVYMIMQGHFTIGGLMAFQGFLGGFLHPIDNFIDVYQSFLGIKNEMERVEDVFDYPNDRAINFNKKDNPKQLSSEILTGKLELKNITFGYSRLAEPLIKDFSFTLEPGKWVALVGGSGSGKSTISKLIMGLYRPWSGEILFDGKTRDEIGYYKFHDSVSMVDQEKILFNDSIKNNIKMWDNSIEDFSVNLATRNANIHKTIITRKDGYNHVIQEGGKDFSGGQCQRMEIARALVTEPVLVILDEATSALDAETEEIVVKNIRNLGCSCVVVAHRLSTIRDCDEIIVFDNGKVAERGTHLELKEKQGAYSKLITNE
jgi:NHLM bacteriocin system ABC transporter peptidase/ATP-binding protein